MKEPTEPLSNVELAIRFGAIAACLPLIPFLGSILGTFFFGPATLFAFLAAYRDEENRAFCVIAVMVIFPLLFLLITYIWIFFGMGVFMSVVAKAMEAAKH